MLQNLEKTNGLYNSQRLMLKLLEKSDFSRENAYKIVQDSAMKSWENNKNFKNIIIKNKKISKILNKKEIEDIFDIQYHLKNIDEIFERVLNEK
jgi:adenylosuccinate lyase